MSVSSAPAALADAGIVDLPALRGLGYGKATTIYPDYVQLESGVQYKDLRVGDADEVTKVGDKLVVDWDGVCPTLPASQAAWSLKSFIILKHKARLVGVPYYQSHLLYSLEQITTAHL